jgi:hypothetical protein
MFIWRDAEACRGDRHGVSTLRFPTAPSLFTLSPSGEPMQVGEIDPRCISNANQLPSLTPEQAAAHTWKPDAEHLDAHQEATHGGVGPS